MTVAARIPEGATPSLRPEALAAPDSGIVEVFHRGFGKPGLIPLWAGEGDLPTPSFIGDAAIAALQEAPGSDLLQIQRLKKRKLYLRDRISFIDDELTPDIIA